MTKFDAYQQALDYLYSFVDYSLTRQLRYSPEKFNLDRMRTLMSLLGNPQGDYRIIHIAGTKGKGSTAALIASALEAYGYQVGFYTSPHLQEFTERIQVNRTEISKDELADLVNEIKPFVSKVPELTTFEITTALALWFFKKKKVDIAVVEVGLGGRLDATNIVDPILSVITSLSYDHMAVLGNTLSQIAFEKAGIIKPKCPVVIAPQKDEARLVIEKVSAERNSELVELGREYLFAPWSHSLAGQTFLVWPAEDQALVTEFIESGGRSNWEPVRLMIPLLGNHQVENAATAFAALQTARKNGLEISDEAIRRGFAQVKWPARFEIICKNPIIVIDSAHNRDSALKLRLALDDYMADKSVTLVFGASEDKDIHGMFEELLPRVKQVIATKSEHPRAIEPEALVNIVHQFGKPAVGITPIETALERAVEMADGEGVVLVAGSIFVAAAAREVWLHKNTLS